MRACPPTFRRRVATALLSLVTLAGAGTLSAQAENPHEADLELTKTAPSSAVVGGTVTYVVKVVNRGSTTNPDQNDLPGTKVEIDDTAPDGLKFLTSEITHRSTNGDRCQTTDQAVHCDIHGNIRPGGVDYVEITITGLVMAMPASGKICNVASVTGNHPDRNEGNNQNGPTSACTTIGGTPSRVADLEIAKDASPKTGVRAGDTITYSLTVDNNGPASALNVVVTDELPEGVEFVGFVGTPPCTEDDAIVSCSIAQLGVNQDPPFSVSYTVTVTAPGVRICNHASVASADPTESDPVPSNNDAEACFDVAPEADLSISKAVNKDMALIGEDVVYTITVHNGGPNTATNVVVTDNVAHQAAVQQVTPAQGTCTTEALPHPQGTKVTCNLGSIESGNDAAVTIRVRPTKKDFDVTNTASVTSNEDPDPGNNTSQTVSTDFIALTPSGAYGELIDVKTILGLHVKSGPLASVTLPPGGGGPISDSAVKVYVTGGLLLKDLVRLDLLKATTQGGKTAGGHAFVASSADVTKASLVNGLITVEKLHSECYATSAPTGSSSSANVVKLRIAGIEVKVAAGPNSKIVVPGVGELILNEQVTNVSGPFLHTRSVNALHLKLDGLLAKGDIILAHSDCGIDP